MKLEISPKLKVKIQQMDLLSLMAIFSICDYGLFLGWQEYKGALMVFVFYFLSFLYVSYKGKAIHNEIDNLELFENLEKAKGRYED